MEKWADYLISEVRYSETKTTKHISHVKVHIDNGETVGAPVVWSREDVINAINLNSTFSTILKNFKNNWSKGAKVEKVKLFSDWYIKTVIDNITKDNLDALPEF